MNKCKTAGNNWSTNVKRSQKKWIYWIIHQIICYATVEKFMRNAWVVEQERILFLYVNILSVRELKQVPSQIFKKFTRIFRLRKNLKEAEVRSRGNRFRAREALLSSLSLYTYNQPQRTPIFGKTCKNIPSYLTVIRVTIFCSDNWSYSVQVLCNKISFSSVI